VPAVAIRLVVLVVSVFLVIIFRPDALPQRNPFLEIWNRWDAPHFLEVARGGYAHPTDPARIVLFPLFPALIALGSTVAEPLVAAMLISAVMTVAASVGLYQLVIADHDREIARLSVVAISIFPTAFAFVAPYSEAPFLAFTVWSLVAARHGDWRSAGILGLLASATRLQGAFLFPALVLQYWLMSRRLGRALLWLALVPVGLVIYLGINFATFGDPLYFVGVQRSVFSVSNIAPWDAFSALVSGVINGPRNEQWATVYLAPLLAELALAVAVAWTLRAWRRRPAEAAYGLLTFVSLSTLSWPISIPRYILGVPAMFSGLAFLAHRLPGGVAVLVMSSIVFTVFLTLFVIGHWAF
jgi:hypothetical protein